MGGTALIRGLKRRKVWYRMMYARDYEGIIKNLRDTIKNNQFTRVRLNSFPSMKKISYPSTEHL